VRIDVVISTLNEERYVERCLEHVLGQDYPRELVSVVLVDGGSTDRTVELAGRMAAHDPRLEVVADGRRRTLPEALNVGIARGSGELVAKIDAHGYPATDFLRRAVEAFDSGGEDIACVGGRPEQTGETEWGVAAALARTSRFGTGGSVYAGTSQRELVDTVQCGVYRREALERVGGFDDSIRFVYFTRASLRGLFRQYRNYGRAKVRVLARHPRFLRPWHLAPAVFVLGAVALVLGAALGPTWLRIAAAACAGTYIAGAVAVAFAAARSPAVALRVVAAFAAIHFGYGTGMLAGLVRLK
jgi:glycosyltransferase involved in cell wall biosynthesis